MAAGVPPGSTWTCGGGVGEDSDGQWCPRDKQEATRLKTLAIAVILIGSALGVALPIVGKRVRHLRPDSSLFFVVKVFAAGVILATAFVHVLPAGQEDLGSPCLDRRPWRRFPMAGAIAMGGAIFTLVVDFAATQYSERSRNTSVKPDLQDPRVDVESVAGQTTTVAGAPSTSSQEEKRSMVVSQVLELGIVTHSVIVGIGLGVSDSPCSIRALIAALVFHQMFEGFALGGCIAQAGFKTVSAWVMALFFSLTTSLGIAVGMGVQSSYDPDTQLALIMQGSLNCFSAGILIYMALVDLIATDFLSASLRLRSSPKLQLCSFLSLFAGVASMSFIGNYT